MVPLYPAAWSQNGLKYRARLFLEGVEQEYDPEVLTAQNLQILVQSAGTLETRTTAPTQSSRCLYSSNCPGVLPNTAAKHCQ